VSIRLRLCNFLTAIKLHNPDCQKCAGFRECWGEEIRKRLEELRRQETVTINPPRPEEQDDAVA
jgi:hypothetical protein